MKSRQAFKPPSLVGLFLLRKVRCTVRRKAASRRYPELWQSAWAWVAERLSTGMRPVPAQRCAERGPGRCWYPGHVRQPANKREANSPLLFKPQVLFWPRIVLYISRCDSLLPPGKGDRLGMQSAQSNRAPGTSHVFAPSSCWWFGAVGLQ